MLFNGADVGESIDISANGDHVRFTRDIGTITMDLHSVEQIQFNALGGADTIVVGDLTGTGVKQVAIDLSQTAGTGVGDGQADTVSVSATAGNDHISVVSSGASVQVNGLAAQVTITGSEGANDSLVVRGLDGNDIINASGLHAGQINLTLDGGNGTDTITGSDGNDVLIGGHDNDTLRGGAGDDTFVWNPGDGSDVLDGGTGTDALVFNGAGVDEKVSISASNGHAVFTRDIGTITMDTDNVETIDFNALGGKDTITVNDLTDTEVRQVNLDLAATLNGTTGDNQDDAVTINGTSGDDVITLSIENGALVIDGLASRVVVNHFDPNDTLTIAGLGGDDVIDASAIGTNGPKLVLQGGDGADVIIGGAGNDTLDGGAGDDVLNGGPGQDVLIGGSGDNVLIQSIVQPIDPAQRDFHLV